MENDQSLQWLGGMFAEQKGQKWKARRWSGFEWIQVRECRKNRLHTELRADVLHAKVVPSRAGLHPAHFLALLSSSFLERPAQRLPARQHLGDWGCNAWVSRLPRRERPRLRLMQMLPPQVLALARQQNKRVKVVGGGHSPSDIACTDGFMIHMGKMNRVLKVLGALGSLPLPHPMPHHPRFQGGRGASFSLMYHPLLSSESQSDSPPPFLVHLWSPSPPTGPALDSFKPHIWSVCTLVATERMSTSQAPKGGFMTNPRFAPNLFCI